MGKLIGFVLGWLIAGPFTAIIGLFIGHQFDNGLASIDHAPPRAQRAGVQQQFFETLFALLGHVAKADGRVSQEEIASTEQFIQQLNLNSSQRRDAIRLFKQGTAAGFNLDEAMIAFLSKCGRNVRLQKTLLELLVHLAYADGVLHSSESAVIRKVAHWLGVRDSEYQWLMAMFKAQYEFASTNTHSQHSLADAYAALGVTEQATDAEVKRAYRRLMSLHHPDKLIAQGVPAEMVKVANEKSQEISAAYERIQAARK